MKHTKLLTSILGLTRGCKKDRNSMKRTIRLISTGNKLSFLKGLNEPIGLKQHTTLTVTIELSVMY